MDSNILATFIIEGAVAAGIIIKMYRDIDVMKSENKSLSAEVDRLRINQSDMKEDIKTNASKVNKVEGNLNVMKAEFKGEFQRIEAKLDVILSYIKPKD